MHPGDVRLFFTDGLTEIFDALGNEFGREQLARAIHQRCRLPLKTIMDEVVTEASNFAEDHQFKDDLCFVGMELQQLAAPDRSRLVQPAYDTAFLRA